MNLFHFDNRLDYSNLRNGICTSYGLITGGEVDKVTINNHNSLSYNLQNDSPEVINTITNPTLLNTSLVSSVMGSCTNYFSNPFGRSSAYPYSFTQESFQDVDFSSPFWTDPGLATSEIKVLNLDGTQVTWLSIDPSTGSISGKAPETGMNYTFNIELKFPAATFTVPFYLNIKKWEFSNWKVWSLESWIECQNGYKNDETSGQCKEDGK